MYKQIAILFLLLILFGATKSISDVPLAKQKLIEDVQNWVALQTNSKPSQIEVAALDRRLRVPTCNFPFEVEFPYSKSKKTVQVKCPSSDWSIFIGVKLANEQTALVYLSDLNAGNSIGADAVKSAMVSASVRGVVTDLKDLKGKRLITDVLAGQLVLKNQLAETVTVFQLKADVIKGDAIRVEDVFESSKATTQISNNNLFPKALLKNATAARSLRSGSTLSRQDLNIRHMVLMTSKTIPRGQKVNSINAKIGPFYGTLPKDALYLISDANNMESMRNLRPNQVLRASDLRPSLMVKKGDSIILSSGSGLLSITTTMIALENGKLNQQISLLNPESNEKIRALITGSGRARSLQSKK
jgi:flagella basal body P-ring formation protein FlgA